MNNLSIASVIEKNQIGSANAMVFALDIDVIDPISHNYIQTIYLVNHTSDITIDGQQYVRIPFMLDLKDEAGEVQNIQLVIQDQAGVVSPYLKLYRGAIGSRVRVSLVTVLPEASEAACVDFCEQFSVVSTTDANYVVTAELGAENPLSRVCPGRNQLRDRCSFRYKSLECGYKGEMGSCDLTRLGKNGCEAHGNVHHFGGFPSIVVKQI